jgi:hypothetical protein
MSISPDQLESAKKLTEIFMPYASRRRAKMIAEAGRFVHYTSAAAGLSIISSKSLWMRNTTCMSDYREVRHGFEIMDKQENLTLLVQSLDQHVAGAGTEAVALFNQWWNDTQFGTFISSISEHDPSEDTHGRLSMWRAFGGGATARIAFVLKLPLEPLSAQSLQVLVSPVAYFREEEVATEICEVATSVQNNLDFLKSVERPILIASIFYMLIMGVVCLKHEGFLEEREWRVIHNPKRMASPHMTFKVETVEGVPQIVYKLPLGGGPPADLDDISIPSMLDRIIIGPSPYPWAMYEAFVTALTAVGVSDAGNKVFVSGIPIRA